MIWNLVIMAVCFGAIVQRDADRFKIGCLFASAIVFQDIMFSPEMGFLYYFSDTLIMLCVASFIVTTGLNGRFKRDLLAVCGAAMAINVCGWAVWELSYLWEAAFPTDLYYYSFLILYCVAAITLLNEEINVGNYNNYRQGVTVFSGGN